MEQTAELKKMLHAQLGLFKRVGDLNTALLKILNAGTDLNGFTIKLNEKNSCLDEIRQRSQQSAPLISDWMQIRDSLRNSTEWSQVEQLLNQIEQVVEHTKKLDESMVEVFNRYLGTDKPLATNDIINAYRALR